MGIDKSPNKPASTRRVQTVRPNTLQAPCDPLLPFAAVKWLFTSNSNTNLVTYYTTGLLCFADMVATMRQATGPEHFICLLGWFCQVDFPLIPTDPNSSLRAIFTNADKNQVRVRAMLWHQIGGSSSGGYGFGLDNSPAVNMIDGLRFGAAIHDRRTGLVGSKHQKILLVNGSNHLIAFCGGMDIVADRISPTWQEAPLHDVHCSVDGPEAKVLARIFDERWQDHQDHAAKDSSKGGLVVVASAPTNNTGGQHYVRIGRTYVNSFKEPMLEDGVNGKPYNWIQTGAGEQTAFDLIKHGIQTATKFIYMEDQYLVSKDASGLLAQKLKQESFKFLVILIPHPDSGVDLEQIWLRRKLFIDDLAAADPSKKKWRVCYLKPPGGQGTYVHSKTFIFDDEFAVTGSANCSRRSYTYDDEAILGITDEAGLRPCKLHFAHQLRMELWAKHLGMPQASLRDAIASVVHWFHPPATAKVAEYNPSEKTDPPPNPPPPDLQAFLDGRWNALLDKDGM
jgi:phosphatidylserine/phosphatidylglycerophosphate/cardiolipin synthase-like enzyme